MLIISRILALVWSDLNVRHLMALRAVAEEGTFGRAAERLGFTQSAVSQQVAALEAMVGQKLFERPSGPRRPELTAAGELLLQQAVLLLGQVEEAENEMDRFTRGITGRLVVGTFQSVSARVLPLVLKQLYEEAPGVEVELVEQESQPDDGAGNLVRGETDVGFAIGPIHDAFDARYLGADRHVAVVPADTPAGPIDIFSLSGSPLIGQPDEDTCGRIIDRQLERLGVTRNYAFRSHDNGAVQGMVAAGMGVALMPLLSVDTNDTATSVRTTTPELAPRELHLVWGKEQSLSPLAERFVEIVAAVCAQLLGDNAAVLN